ncbi:protein TE30 [Testudinid alphaherpesvirus 3]|uniref:Protein TE30 n=1 Tax=Testudinid alphaherpesvirus 3 TaxID=2560801 RepID=A0A0M3MXJ1_9ALPH|nr:protein TE30 [Testudinid alphaherpesvirus 3]AKI81687.1 protein TE30 [Testudinid alphaherpesvirus 3]AKI81790.1 protein TE30 [Testudinid alphaherpesvirus 3]
MFFLLMMLQSGAVLTVARTWCRYPGEYLAHELYLDKQDTWWYPERRQYAHRWHYWNSQLVTKGSRGNYLAHPACESFNRMSLQLELDEKQCTCIQRLPRAVVFPNSYVAMAPTRSGWKLYTQRGFIGLRYCTCVNASLESHFSMDALAETRNDQFNITMCAAGLFSEYMFYMPCQFNYECIVVNSTGRARYYESCRSVPDELPGPVYVITNWIENIDSDILGREALRLGRALAVLTNGSAIIYSVTEQNRDHAFPWRDVRCFGDGPAGEACLANAKHLKTYWQLGLLEPYDRLDLRPNITILVQRQRVSEIPCQHSACILFNESDQNMYAWLTETLTLGVTTGHFIADACPDNDHKYSATFPIAADMIKWPVTYRWMSAGRANSAACCLESGNWFFCDPKLIQRGSPSKFAKEPRGVKCIVDRDYNYLITDSKQYNERLSNCAFDVMLDKRMSALYRSLINPMRL